MLTAEKETSDSELLDNDISPEQILCVLNLGL